MSDPTDPTPPRSTADPATASMPSASASSSSDESQHAQAVRFLTSLNARRSSATGTKSEEEVRAEQRGFLRAKGLREDQIDAALRDAERPASQDAVARPAAGANGQEHGGVGQVKSEDDQAWDAAALAFNDPLHAQAGSTMLSLPSKDYPPSPLALYYDQRSANGAQGAAGPITPRDRYKVLLRFFARLSYASVLGGGVAAVAVALYRAYILPRLTDTLSARSALLKHHHDQYGSLLEKVRQIGRQALGGPVRDDLDGETKGGALTHGEDTENGISAEGANAAVKKVTFSDEVVEEAISSLDVPTPASGSTEEKETKSALKKSASSTIIRSDKPDAHEITGSATDKTGAAPSETELQPTIKPIFLFDDLCASLGQLSIALKGETNASSSNGNGKRPHSLPRPRPVTTLGSKAATVFSESSADEDWESSLSASEGEGANAEQEEEDELEFDPFAPIPRRSQPKPRRRAGPSSRLNVKHSPSPLSASASNPSVLTDTSKSSATNPRDLYSRLSSLNSYINAQSFLSSTHEVARYNGPLGLASSHNAGSGYLSASASESESPLKARGGATQTGANHGSHAVPGNTDQQSIANHATRTTDVNQLKAEIRSLKGLLLSRRNFPSYARPPAVHSS